MIQPLERRNRAARIAEFAVVIVLKYPRTEATRGTQQLETSRQGHRDAERVLMRRRHSDESRRGFPELPKPNVESLRVNRNRNNACTGCHQRAVRTRIHRILHPGSATRIEQHLRCDKQSLL